jgi:hypothetical protein
LDGPAETAKFDRSNHQNPVRVCTFVGHEVPLDLDRWCKTGTPSLVGC